MINRGMIKSDGQCKSLMQRVKIYDNAAEKSKTEIGDWKKKIKENLKRIEELDTTREKAGHELSLANHKYL